MQGLSKQRMPFTSESTKGEVKMSEVTGNIRTCPKASHIFFCKYCEYDSDCGTQLLEMTEEERKAHYKRIFDEFEEWRISTFPTSQERKEVWESNYLRE